MNAVIPTIFSSTLKDFKTKLINLSQFSSRFHIDIGDGRFVSYKTPKILSYANYLDGNLSCEIHLMVNKPLNYLDVALAYKADRVYVHLEIFSTVDEAEYIVKKFKEQNILVGFALNPKTRVEDYIAYYYLVDSILLMSVEPGAEGQEFQKNVLGKVHQLRSLKSTLHIEIDGGINSKTAKLAYKKGVNSLAVGSYISKASNPKKNYENLLKK